MHRGLPLAATSEDGAAGLVVLLVVLTPCLRYVDGW